MTTGNNGRRFGMTAAQKFSTMTFGKRGGKTKRKKSTTVRTKANKKSRKVLTKTKKMETIRTPLTRIIIEPFRTDKPGVSLLTISRLIQPTPAFNSHDVTVLRFKGDRVKRAGVHHRAIATETKTDDGNKRLGIRYYKQTVYAKDPSYNGPLYKCPSVIVHCQCDYHKYYAEYALWYNGSAEICLGNGQPAVRKNPKNIPFACKHLFMTYRKLKEKKL